MAVKDKLSFSEFWTIYCNKFPLLYQIMLETNIIESTSISSDSYVNVSGYIQLKDRARLSPNNLRYTMLSRDYGVS